MFNDRLAKVFNDITGRLPNTISSAELGEHIEQIDVELQSAEGDQRRALLTQKVLLTAQRDRKRDGKR